MTPLTASTTTLQALSSATQAEFTALLDGIYEHSPWIAERAWAQRPFTTPAALKHALVQAVRAAGRDAQIGLIRAHPELAGRAMVSRSLTAESTDEQSRAGLTDCTPAEFAQIQALNAAYNARFGWPFILAVRGPAGRGLTRTEIIAHFARRLEGTPDFEFAESLRQIHRIAEIRLNDRLALSTALGQRVLAEADALAQHSDPGYAEHGQLCCTYLTPAHQAVARQLQVWMHEAGFDEATVDAVGNVVGVYHAASADAPRLLTGSHYDTVRNAGRYDGRLGILVPIAVVRGLHAAGRRLPFALEVVGFAEEEGQRYKATFLGSSALTGGFDAAWLTQPDADGVTMAKAMQAAGLPGTLPPIAALARDAARYLGFVEVHIEQGPVLDALDLPLGVVTSINGSVRYVGQVQGTASHAGTTPMGLRRDAACAVAELTLAVERLATAQGGAVSGAVSGAASGSVGTVGQLEVPGGSINVVPGRCRFSLDLRAPTDDARDALDAAVLAELQRIVSTRGLQHSLERTVRAAAAPSHPAWQQRWERAVAALGLPVHHLPSGAGHDAMKLHECLPQAMLFVRGGNAGISHNPLESITADDAQLCIDAFVHLVDALARDGLHSSRPPA